MNKFNTKYPIKKISDNEYRIESNAKQGMNVPVTIYANEALLEKMLSDRTIDQAVNVTHLPGIYKHAIVLPDGHEGYGFPIGGVAATDAETGVISPGGVGYDINCGVRILQTNLTEKDVRPKLKQILSELHQAVPSGLGSKGRLRLTSNQLNDALNNGVEWAISEGYGNEKDAEFCEENGRMNGADTSKVSPIAKSRGLPQLGSLGSGNHFLEVQVIDKIFDNNSADCFDLKKEGQIAIMIHTGSRGLGYQICSDYLKVIDAAAHKYNISLPDRELACAPITSNEATSYIAAMAAALNYAWSNRQMITHWTRQVFSKIFDMSEDELGLKLVYDVAHNIAKIEEHNIDGEKRRVMVHRKGATRAFPSNSIDIPFAYRDVGQPVLIPGSMGTSSWILRGTNTSMDISFGSTAHGAGRLMSRSAAIRLFQAEDIKKDMLKKGILVQSASWKGIVEESPGAYKNVDSIAEVSDNLGIAKKVVRLRPIGVLKG